MKFASSLFLFIAVALPGTLWSADPPGAARVDFSREILPILSNKCFVCHGPDTTDTDMLRLDSYAAATSDRGDYRAIDPASPEKSQVLVRINSADDPMPPADAERQLTAAERELLDRWVRQGGDYEIHWAFRRPLKAAVPGGETSTHATIDRFIQAKLAARGIDLAPEADRTTLARRLALVLTGLPPEPEHLRRFLADESDQAYERYVDELLADASFGEHQARYWLDAVRYGDTHGLHLDNRRGIYPYRDWVVRAMNENMPFDQFITWQLAGDLLPDPTLEQRVATGFVRMNPSTAEGGAIPAEFQAKNNFDRTEMLGTVLLGMSLTCARCHTHKYDPIPQQEYYELLAFFNSTAEHSMDGNAYVYAPVVDAPENQAAWKRWDLLETEARKLVNASSVLRDRKLAAALEHAKSMGDWQAQSWQVSGPFEADSDLPAEPVWKAAKGLPGTGQEKLPEPGKALWLDFKLTLPADQTLWLHLDGGKGSRLIVGKEVVAELDQDGLRQFLSFELPSGEHQVRVKLAGIAGRPAVRVELVDAWKDFANSGTWEKTRLRSRLLLLADSHGPFAELNQQAAAGDLASQLATASATFTTTLVAQDLTQPRETKILRRGEYNLPIGEPLLPDVLSVMGEMPAEAPRNRLGLAQWLTSAEHPLVTRVLINRIWQRTFGHGLVRTPEDFGVQGEQPTHPELLDWLAVDFQQHGWDLKRMLREMVLSRTFRQKSAWRTEVQDPENRLFARGPRHRLDAEIIRDIGLWSSGLLDPHQGGEGVKPYQPSGMWQALAHPGSNTKKYVRDHGTLLYRKSLYVYWKRTSPHPMMTLFDAPDRESSCVRRSRTNTPLQSLGLLNETQRVEMARCLAERVIREEGSDAARLRFLFELLTCRPPSDSEATACMSLLEQMKQRYSTDSESATKLLITGDAERDESIDPVLLAAWSQVTTVVLASDMVLLLY